MRRILRKIAENDYRRAGRYLDPGRSVGGRGSDRQPDEQGLSRAGFGGKRGPFIQNPVSIYADSPGETYHFPRQYLSTVDATVGDWVILYEGRKGAFAYTGFQKIQSVRPDPTLPGHFFADVVPGSLETFEQPVSREDPLGRAYETALRGPDGRATSGGANVSAVRRLSVADFWTICAAGSGAIADASALPRDPTIVAQNPFIHDPQAAFSHLPDPVERDLILSSRSRRDAAFSRVVRRAYGNRCAISGLELRNGGGRPEVEAAHIRPVGDGGPDVVQNGLALSGTLHWMFDRGLIPIAQDHSVWCRTTRCRPRPQTA